MKNFPLIYQCLTDKIPILKEIIKKTSYKLRINELSCDADYSNKTSKLIYTSNLK